MAGGQNDIKFQAFLFGYFFAKGSGIRVAQDTVLTDSIKHAIMEQSCNQISYYPYIFVRFKISRELTKLKSIDSSKCVSQITEEKEYNKPPTLPL